MRSPASLRFGLATVSLAFIACGGAASEPKAPPAQKDVNLDAEGPGSVAEAQDQIARAKRELEHAAVSQEAKTSDSSAPPAPPADSKTPKKTTTAPVSPSTPPRSEARPAQPQDGLAGKHEDLCGNPCKAITSMRRAVTALCRMTGEEDGRCVDAKRTLASSEARVASCPCAKG